MKMLELDNFVIVSFWATASLVNFSPMSFEFVLAVFATIGFDISTHFSICRAYVRAYSAGPAINSGYKEFYFCSFSFFLLVFFLVLIVMDVSD